MKIKELFESTQFQNFTDPDDIKSWLEENADQKTCDGALYNYDDKEFTIVKSVTFQTDFKLKGMNQVKLIPFKIDKVGNNFDISAKSFSDTLNFPNRVANDCILSFNDFKTFPAGIPNVGRDLYLTCELLNDLTNTDEIMRELYVGRSLLMAYPRIKRGGISLILIQGLEKLETIRYDLPPPFEIINKYVGRPDDIFECQAELIENGFEEYAIL